ncbi:MAG: TonB family protein [Vicinamibacterales bacterium]
MARDLFGDVTRPFAGVGARSRLTVPLSLAAHALALVALVVVPLLASAALPAVKDHLVATVITPLVPPEPPAFVPRTSAAVPVGDAAPTEAPDGLPTIDPGAIRVAEVPDLGVVTGPIESAADLAPPPPPPAPPVAQVPQVVRPGAGIAPPTKIQDAAPVYPTIARQARVQGLVIVEATIDTTGAVVDARVLRSVPLLDAAALAAVRQWRYTPTRLNGQPVSVLMTVTVQFQLR